MKITVNEDPKQNETEVIINCREADEHILKMISSLRVYDSKLIGSKDGETYVLNTEKILYIDTVDKKTFIYGENDYYETGLRLYELEDKLLADDFLRATKSSIINFNKIKALRPEFGGRMLITMDNGEKLFVSRQYVPSFKKKLGI